ncbi:MAG: TatD family hydrolase [Sphingomonadaceae bacterium]|uniref:TatD family hydrolase n=1 Tax=Thermaurantiacus sp. TaxID=2820283 RepID=UPI00298F1080|nr:TatD family hydrolase [Thermaurantiacus sp.]MCS6985832.1 TatD family hydrolase [Sphingomonadaceae bacterium]MDW8413899.1 TatD family hydrolase [Thermaurantiacus sp.]
MPIDSHCHLNYPGLVEDEAGVLARARAAGVRGLLNVATRPAEWPAVVGAADRHADVWATVGVHPHEANAHADLAVDDLVEAARHPRVVAIGETGLDYHDDRSDRAAQRQLFRRHLMAAQELGLPVVVHSRDAEEDTVRLLAEAAARGPLAFVMHCFTGSPWLAHQALALGGYISFSGILTFRSAGALREVAAGLPADRLLVETDAPFLAPVPLRGRTCEPAFVVHTLQALAQLKGEELAELDRVTMANTCRLFRLAEAECAS